MSPNFLLAALFVPAPAFAVILYDGSTLPSAQGWTTIVPPPATQTLVNPGVRLDTTAAFALQGGFGYDTPSGLLSTTTGFAVSFTSALLSESHNSDSRAGFTAIIVADNLSAVEFDFHPDKIYTQSLDFTIAESVNFTTLPLTTYTVTVSGSTYSLSANNSELLTGPLRPYATSPNPGAQYYSVPGSLFFGDNTGSAIGTSLLTNVTVVPEPAAATAILPALMFLTRRRRTNH